MNTQLITHVFASLQNLEKCLGNIKKMLPSQGQEAQDIAKVLPEQERVLDQMRKVANKLQFDVAKNDWAATVRLLKIFYGLNYMVRTDIMNAFTRLSKEQHTVQLEKLQPQGKETVYH